MNDEVSAEYEEYERHYTLNKSETEVAALETKIRHFEKERRLWQAVARAAEAVEKALPDTQEVVLPQQDILWLALNAARAAGLSWEEET